MEESGADVSPRSPRERSGEAQTYERLTQAINEARDRGDIALLERIAKDPQAFIRQQGWAAVSLDVSRCLEHLRALYEHLQARILEMIETLDEMRGSPDYEISRFVERDAGALERIAGAQREELAVEIAELKAAAERLAGEVRELSGEVPF